MTEESGESVRLLGRFGPRYAAAVRIAVVLPIGAIAMLRAAPENSTATAVVVGVVVVWTFVYARWLTRANGHLPLALDVVVLLGACLCSFWTNAADDVNFGWLRLLVTVACVTYQWYSPPLAGGVAALVTCGGLLMCSAAAGADAGELLAQAWVLPAPVMSRVGWTLVLRAARRADGLAAEAEQARRVSKVDAAVRADQREFANALHDTAATTLLMVGTGQVSAGAGWLAPQARRDLERLRSGGSRPPERADLVALLREDLGAAHLAVEFSGPAELWLPVDVASAIADATTEALNNVRRHSGSDRAIVRLRGDSAALRLDIVDQGRGFSVDDVPASRRGLRHSVHGRMNRLGGTATVSSVVGAGTTVRLEWRVPTR